VVVDFTGHAGRWVLSNAAATPYPSGDPTVATIPSLMRFDVGTTITGVDRSSVPSTIKESNNQVPATQSLDTARLRTVQAAEKSPGVPQLGNAIGVSTFTDPVTETPYQGSTEAWAMRNHSRDTHPIHEHLVELRLGRTLARHGVEPTGSDYRKRRSTGSRRVRGAGRVGVRAKRHLRLARRLHHGLGRRVHDRRDIGVALPHPVPRGWYGPHGRDDAATGGPNHHTTDPAAHDRNLLAARQADSRSVSQLS
jgi:hypothetical protein